jgi:hypothetical protein
MHVSFQPIQEEASAPEPAASRPECCPLCCGPLLPLQSHYRCARCHFSLCVGCENAEEASE